MYFFRLKDQRVGILILSIQHMLDFLVKGSVLCVVKKDTKALLQ